MSELKVFELRYGVGEKEWLCAHTNIEALKTYASITGVSLIDLDEDDEIVEVPKEKWAELHIKNNDYDESDPEDWSHKSFEDYMKTQTIPDIIAGTMYE